MSDPLPSVAVILPPREGFGPNRAGAIGLLVRRLLRAPGFRATVFGGAQDAPVFAEAAFRAVMPALWPPAPANTRYAVAVAALLRRQPPALIEVHNRPEIALTLAARLPRIPVTLILNNDPQTMVGAATAAERTTLLARLARVITASDYLRTRLLDGVPPPARPPAVLHNCLDLAEAPSPRPREQRILFAGRVVPDKAPDAFVAACAIALPSLSGWSAAIIGADRFALDSPDTAFVLAVRAAAETAGVAMLGYRDHPDVLEAMSRAAIVVVPSRWQEPFGLVALEALACGAALICSPNGGLPEVAGDAALYARPDNPAAIADAIRLLARDHARREALSLAGRARARLFDLGVIGPRLADLRHQAIAGAG
jgi:UDP-glucose:(glucosyl)LPS alpha-1,2-glucosyltransferase